MTEDTAGTVGDTGPPLYVYGVLPAAAAPLGSLPRGVGGGGAPELVQAGELAVVASAVPEGWATATREDAEAHERVTSSLAERHTLVPMRFGTVMPEAEIRETLLGRHGQEIAAVLRELDGCVQMSVKAYYGADALLRHTLRAHPELKRRSQELESQPPERTVGERVALGQEVARAVEDQRRHDEQVLVEGLTPLVRELRAEPVGGERMAANLQLLVERRQRAPLDAAVAKLAEAHSDRFAVRYVGPLAPYSFVDLSLEAPAWG